MEIEFRNVPLIKQVCDRVTREINNALRKQDVTYSQIQMLLRLFEAGEPLSFKELEKRLGVSQAATARLANFLAAKGYLNIKDDLSDGRVKRAELTAIGEYKCCEAHSYMDAIELNLGLTPIEAAIFHELMKKILESPSI